MELTNTKIEMRDRKKDSCCEWSAPVNSYRYLLKGGMRKMFQIFISSSMCTAIIFVKLSFLQIFYLDQEACRSIKS
jgi:hypothetical protein